MTDPAGVERTELLTAALAAAPPIERARLMRVVLPPGQASGPHHHPCDVVGTILSGTIRFRTERDDDVVLLRTGDAFFEPRDVHVLQFDNADDAQPATFLACYLLAPGEEELIRFDAPS